MSTIHEASWRIGTTTLPSGKVRAVARPSGGSYTGTGHESAARELAAQIARHRGAKLGLEHAVVAIQEISRGVTRSGADARDYEVLAVWGDPS